MSADRKTRKGIRRWIAIEGVLIFGVLYFLCKSSGRVVMERSLNTGGCLIGPAPDGRMAMIDGQELVKISINGSTEVTTNLSVKSYSSVSAGTNGFLLYDLPFGRTGTLRMYDWKGRQLWSFSHPWISSPPAVSREGAIYFSDVDRMLCAMNVNGAQRWTRSTYSSPDVPFWTPAVGLDGRVAIAGGNKELMVLNRDGRELWRHQFELTSSPGVGAAFADNENLIVSTGLHLRCYDQKGFPLWDLDLDRNAKRHGGAATINGPPVVGADGTIYCLARERVIAVASDGRLLWKQTVARYVPNNWSRVYNRDWATFTPSGDLVTFGGDFEVLQNPSSSGPGMPVAGIGVNERLICLGKDGSIRWEQPIPKSISWRIPHSLWDWKVLWRSHMGLDSSANLRALMTAADGTIYVSGTINGKTKIWAIRSD